MRNPQRHLYATFGVAFLLTGCGPGPGGTAPAATQAGIAPVADANPKCQKFMKVTSTNDPHLQLEERFRITGPTHHGDYGLRPVGGGHDATSKDHDVVKSSPSGNDFEAEIEIKSGPGGPHGSPTPHYYSVVMQLDSGGCPSKLNFDTMVHAGDQAGQSHGGDAVMN
jgi:hypothetical protein